jgi:hypothetical protein
MDRLFIVSSEDDFSGVKGRKREPSPLSPDQVSKEEKLLQVISAKKRHNQLNMANDAKVLRRHGIQPFQEKPTTADESLRPEEKENGFPFSCGEDSLRSAHSKAKRRHLKADDRAFVAARRKADLLEPRKSKRIRGIQSEVEN